MLWFFSPCSGLSDWHECLSGTLHLFFKPHLPAPNAYKKWLAKHIRERHFIPYVFDAALGHGCMFEGATHADVLLLNETNGFAVLVESKVSSDVSDHISLERHAKSIGALCRYCFGTEW